MGIASSVSAMNQRNEIEKVLTRESEGMTQKFERGKDNILIPHSLNPLLTFAVTGGGSKCSVCADHPLCSYFWCQC